MRDSTRPVHLRGFHPRLLAPNFALLVGVLLVAAICGTVAQEAATPGQPQNATFGITCVLKDSLGHPVSDLAIEVRSATPPLVRAASVTLPDGSITFNGLTAGLYNVTVAGAILLPPKQVQINGSRSTLELQLPITLPQVAGRRNDTVSVNQLSVPDKAQEALRKAYEAWEKNDTKQSRMQAIRALELHPYYGPALSLLGILELQEGHPADAINGLQQAVQYNPNSPRTYLALGSAYNELHQNANALYALSIMAKLLPESWQLHYEVGRAYLGQGRFQAAMDEFNRGQQIAPREVAVLHVGKAHALIGMRNYPAARAELETVIRKSPDGPYASESRELAVVLDSQLKKVPPKSDATAHAPIPAKVEH
jgi:Flp pilus assembly protein TadD